MKTKKIKFVGFNPRSPKQVQKIIQTIGLPLTKRIKTGFSTGEEVLLTLKGQHEFIDTLLDYREVFKQLSTYILPLLNSDEVIYPNFNQVVVPEGRLSSSNPNIQNITKYSDIGKKLRKSFIAKPGHLLLANDYSQLHLRILAHFSKDKTMVEAYKDGQDLHQVTADSLNVPRNPTAKTINFGIIYSIGAKALSRKLCEEGHNVNAWEAGRYIDLFFAKYKGVKAWKDFIINYAQVHGFAPSLFKARVPLININYSGYEKKEMMMKFHEERKAVNAPILMTEAQIVKKAMIKIYNGLNLVPIWQVHDDLTYELPENEVENLMPKIKNIMENAVSLCVPLVVDQKVGKNWSEI